MYVVHSKQSRRGLKQWLDLGHATRTFPANSFTISADQVHWMNEIQYSLRLFTGTGQSSRNLYE